jgi:DNA-binding MarR family transcriptional regulator
MGEMTDERGTDGRLTLANGDALDGCGKPLSAVQLSCLKVIDDVWPETITPAEVATRVGVPTNTAVAHVGALVKAGFVYRAARHNGVSYRSAHSPTG